MRPVPQRRASRGSLPSDDASLVYEKPQPVLEFATAMGSASGVRSVGSQAPAAAPAQKDVAEPAVPIVARDGTPFPVIARIVRRTMIDDDERRSARGRWLRMSLVALASLVIGTSAALGAVRLAQHSLPTAAIGVAAPEVAAPTAKTVTTVLWHATESSPAAPRAASTPGAHDRRDAPPMSAPRLPPPPPPPAAVIGAPHAAPVAVPRRPTPRLLPNSGNHAPTKAHRTSGRAISLPAELANAVI